MTPELEHAYRSTSYRITVPGKAAIDLRVGVRSPRLDALLTGMGSELWAFITAWNPASRPLSAAENRVRHAGLLEQVLAGGWRYFPGAGIPDRVGWTPEDSLLVLDISRKEAVGLGRRFGQHAILVGRLGGAPELVDLADE